MYTEQNKNDQQLAGHKDQIIAGGCPERADDGPKQGAGRAGRYPILSRWHRVCGLAGV